VLEPALDRLQSSTAYGTLFVHLHNDTVHQVEPMLSNTSVTVLPFEVKRITEVGGFLSVELSFKRADIVGPLYL
jgi:hypothetical protein